MMISTEVKKGFYFYYTNLASPRGRSTAAVAAVAAAGQLAHITNQSRCLARRSGRRALPAAVAAAAAAAVVPA